MLEGVFVDRLSDRITGEMDVIGVSDLDRVTIASLPETALVAALRRATDQYADETDHYTMWQEAPPLLSQPG